MDVFDKIEKILNTVIILILTLMVIFVFSQVIARYVLGRPLRWSGEVSRHLMIWLVFIGSAVTFRNDGHLSIDILEKKLEGLKKKILRLLFLVIISVFLIFMIYYGFHHSINVHSQIASAGRYPMSYVYSSIPIGGFFMFLFAIEKFIKIFKSD